MIEPCFRSDQTRCVHFGWISLMIM
jgi:hypothetical protein